MGNKVNDLPLKKVINFFLIYSAVTSAISLILLAFYLNSKYFDGFYGSMIFSDFAEVLLFCKSKNPYAEAPFFTQYPPIAFLIFKPLSLIYNNILDYPVGMSEEYYYSTVLPNVYAHPAFIVGYVIFFAICLTALLFLSAKLLKDHGKLSVKNLVFLIFTSSFIFLFLRGNVMIISLIATLFFIVFYKNENKVLRELSLILLAFAGAIKIYPLVFGTLLLKEKRFMESLRVAAYFAVLLFLPFLFIEGGFNNIHILLNNMFGFVDAKDRLIGFNNISFEAIFTQLIYYTFGRGVSVNYTVISIIAKVITILIFVFGIVGAVFTKSKFKTSLILSALIIIVPAVSYYYAPCFLIVPMAFFVIEYEELSNKDKLSSYILLFLLNCMAFLLVRVYTVLGLTILILLIMTIIDCIVLKIKNKNGETNEGCNFSRG